MSYLIDISPSAKNLKNFEIKEKLNPYIII